MGLFELFRVDGGEICKKFVFSGRVDVLDGRFSKVVVGWKYWVFGLNWLSGENLGLLDWNWWSWGCFILYFVYLGIYCFSIRN